MCDRQKMNLQVKNREDYLQEVFHRAAEEEGKALWKAFEAERAAGTLPEIPAELDEKCKELIRASGRKSKKDRCLKCAGIGLKRAAVIILVLMCFVSTMTMSAEAVRLPVLNFLVDKDNRFSTVFLRGNRTPPEDVSLFDKALSVPPPEGYKLINQWYMDNGSFKLWFENELALSIQVNFFSAAYLVNYDTEDAEQVRMKVAGHDAIFIKKDGLRVVWMDEENNGVFDVRVDKLTEQTFWKYVLRIAEP